jgi:alanyl-tRNA synthetase
MNNKKIKDIFINYFKSKNHVFVPSSSVIPNNDDSLLFINAGMNQFKSIFINEDIPDEFKLLKRACNYQRCIRAGGKHNDLDDVGKDVYHHTYFEMLGSWSFDDYGKEEAIDMAWDLLINYYKINPDNLYVTYYEGDEKLNLSADLETYNFWKKYVSESHIIKGNSEDNFWSMGNIGPCGPCTEIHYDRIGNRNASELVNKDDPDVLEIWNIVSIEYNMLENDNLIKLESKFIDTGMGFERLTSILQNKTSNYDTDIFLPIMEIIQKEIGCERYTGKINDDINHKDMSYRVLSDHLRTMIISINDGCIPGPNGRDYVIRKIIRRSMLFGDKLGAKTLFLADIAKKVINILNIDELKSYKIIDIIMNEEILFRNTLNRGKKVLKKKIKNLKKNNNKILSGETAFKLYTGVGLPFDIIKIICDEENIIIDTEIYYELLENHKYNH